MFSGLSFEDVQSFITVDSDMEVYFGSDFRNTRNLISIRNIDMHQLDFNINIRELSIDSEFVELIVSNDTFNYLLKICD